MITDIVPLTISATTMFVQVQMVGGKSHVLCGSLNSDGASTRTPAEQITSGYTVDPRTIAKVSGMEASAVDRLTDDLVVGPTFAR
jgi:hypothetical protein